MYDLSEILSMTDIFDSSKFFINETVVFEADFDVRKDDIESEGVVWIEAIEAVISEDAVIPFDSPEESAPASDVRMITGKRADCVTNDDLSTR